MAASLAAGAAGGVASGAAADLLVDEPDRELGVLRDLPAALVEEQRSFPYLVLATLWENRATNGLFAVFGLEGMASHGRAAPPPRVLLDPSGHLRPWGSLDEDGRDAWADWRNDERQRFSIVDAILEPASAEYGESGS